MKAKPFKTLLLIALVLFAAGCSQMVSTQPVFTPEPSIQITDMVYESPSPAPSATPPSPLITPEMEVLTPKYVFYFIGDGMGEGQRQLAEAYLQYRTGNDDAQLAMSTLPVNGTNTTETADGVVTDSAASGTALACGVKTLNGMIGQTPDGQNAVSILEAAEGIGMATGVVSTTRITHATPAVFYAHTEHRGNENDIALQLVASGVDFVAGGGISQFLPVSYSGGGTDAMGEPLTAGRADDTDVLAALEAAGCRVFFVENSARDLSAYSPQAGDQVFAALAQSHLPMDVDRRNADTDLPSLADITQKAVDLLRMDEDGFFLMVEGGRIDHACHENDVAGTVHDMLAFDDAIRAALVFYEAHPDDTLIIVLADHETGGLQIGPAQNFGVLDDITATFEGTYGYAYAPEGDRDSYFNLLESIGLTDLTDEEKAAIEAGMDMDDAGEHTEGYANYPETGIAAAHVISDRVGARWSGFWHTGAQTPYSVIGAGQSAFGGEMDNTDMANTLAELLGVDIGR